MILITGSAGFIGFTLAKKLLEGGQEVVGLDNINNYYDPQLKEDRLKLLSKYTNFSFEKVNLSDKSGLVNLFKKYKVRRVVNLAAQAGVRYSLENPDAYVESNLIGFVNILECCRHNNIEHLVYASTSSAYGANTKQPFTEDQNVDHPMALYAATKRANELMAHSYASLYNLPCTGLRFFTVYGPWGRPDMALFKFTKNIIEGKPIDVYNNGQMVRDFTYVDDIVEGVARTLAQPATPDAEWDSNNPNPAISYAPYRIYNIGNSQPVELMTYIKAIEEALGKEAKCKMMPIQAGDVPSTHADTTRLEKDFGYKPQTTVESGVKKFVEWYVDYFK